MNEKQRIKLSLYKSNPAAADEGNNHFGEHLQMIEQRSEGMISIKDGGGDEGKTHGDVDGAPEADS